MIHRLRHMIGTEDTTVQTFYGAWVRAVPLPFRGNWLDRLGDAWAVFKGAAFAVDWPSPGELENALSPKKSVAA